MPYELYSQEKIVNHQENHSPTKFMYSFGHAKRFPPLDRRGFSDSLYNFPSFGSGKKIGIGYGQKTDFTRKSLITEIVGIKRDFDADSNHRGLAIHLDNQEINLQKLFVQVINILIKIFRGQQNIIHF